MRQRQKLLSILAIAGLLFQPIGVLAQSSSSNYKIEETFFGTGGEVDASSTSYRSQQSAGSLGVGNVSSASFDGILGFVTPSEPFLEFVVTNASIDLGVLSDTTTSYGSPNGGACACSFYVRTYISSGYVVINASNQPATNESGAFLAPKTTQGVPSASASVEEFGFNLVANTSPGTFGASPVNIRDQGGTQVSDNSFADGAVATGYQTPDNFKFVAGDIIAQSPATVGNQAVGQTNYTISYIAKRKSLTPAGLYTLQHDLIAVATY